MHLRTLGEFQLLDQADGRPLLSASKPLALVAYLALSDRAPVSRDHLVDLLWGHVSSERGRHALRQTLHALRRDLGSGLVEFTGNLVQLGQPISSDRDAFLANAKGPDPDRALAIYRGPFLQDVAFPGGDRFEQWAARVRERLHDLWLSVTATSVERLLQDGDAAAALQRAEELRQREPEREAFWRLVIAAHLQQGNTRAARHEAESLQRQLRARDLRPETATAELLRQLVDTGTPGVAAPRDLLAEPELVGRDAAFAWLLGTWRLSTRGPAQVVHVHGGAGVGKSRLLEALAARIDTAGGAVAPCRATSGERVLAHATLASCVDRLARRPGAVGMDPASTEALVRLAPALRSLFPGARPQREETPEPHVLVAAIADLLRSLTTERPLTILLDDVHWGDPASLEILGAAIGRVRGLPLMVITAGRQLQGLPGLEARPLLLEPLGVAMVGRLLGSIGDLTEADGAWLTERVHQATDGNPMLVLELLRLLLREEALRIDEGAWIVTDRTAVDALLRERPPLLDRLRGIGPGERRALEFLALIGQPTSVATLAAMVGAGPESTAAALATLELAGLVRDAGGPWEVSHDRFAEAVLAEIPADRMRDLRHQVATALVREAGHDEAAIRQAVAHASASGDPALLTAMGRQWIRARRRNGASGSSRRLVRQLATATGTTGSLPHLMRGVPWHARTGPRLAIAGIGAILIVAVAMQEPATAPPAYRLRLDGEPMLDWVRGSDAGLRNFVAPITVVAVDADGRRDTTATAMVRARLVGKTATLDGESVVPLRDGEAVFDGLQVRFGSDTLVHVELAADGHGVFATVPLALNENERATLHLLGGTLNGQELDPDDPVLRLAPGAPIRGSVTLRYRSDWESASVILCAVGTWRRGAEGTWPIAPQRTPVTRATIRRDVAIPGPSRPGVHHLILVFRAETDCAWIASQTNWFYGAPAWNDGDDIADIPAEELVAARERGYLTRSLKQDSIPRNADYALQAIRVEVD